jgi:hypothetical protein
MVTCRVIRDASHHCVPSDGSAHAVIVESTPEADMAPVAEQPHFPGPQQAAPAIVETPSLVVPQPVTEPLQPLEPIAPVSAEKPLTPPPGAVPATPPTTQPQFKSAAEILAESAEQQRMEKAALEAATPPGPPAAEPQFKTATEILAESAAQAELDSPATAPAAEPPMKKTLDEQPAVEPEPAPTDPATDAATERAPKKPAPKPAEENLFDEADDEPAAEEPAEDKPAPMKKAPAEEPVEDLFGEPEAGTPADDQAPAAKESADEAPAEEKTEQAEDDPFALLDASPEPVRRWIDSTGRHQTIGRLVEVHPDRIRILKSNGHYTTVPLERLSRHDQSYVTQVGERIAAKRPAVTDTAQR